MSPAQRTMLFGMVSRIAKARGVKPDALRSEVTLAEFSGARSWGTFGDAEVDRVKAALLVLADELNIGAVIQREAYRAHDAAQASHVPVARPGKAEQRKAQPRRWASRYERTTDADDPGRRKRLVYWISRLFSPAYVHRVAGDLCGVTAWQEMPLPQLTLLKDTLKNRLGKWLTRHKEKHDFGFSIAGRKPRSRTGLLTNEELIAELLERSIALDLSQ